MRFFEARQFVSSSLKGYEFTATSVEHAPHRHEVLFYSDDAVFLDSLARFIGIALRSGDVAIVAISESHRDGSCSEIEGAGAWMLMLPHNRGDTFIGCCKTLSTFM